MTALRGLFAALATVASGIAFMAPASVAAQVGSLERVDSLVAVGSVIPARKALEEWWGRGWADADRSSVQRALWLRGLLTLDARDAELDYRRLVVEYPGGPYTDRALVRLARAAHARDDLRSAAGHFRTLLRDYPGSPLREEARAWLSRFGDQADANGGRNGRRPEPRDSLARAGAPEEDRTTGESGEAPLDRALPYAVQLGAFSSETRARRLLDRARSAGLDARLVRIPGSRLVRVRLGRFADSPGAEPVLREVRDLGFEATIVTDAVREVTVP